MSVINPWGVTAVLDRTDWAMLRDQKQRLVETIAKLEKSRFPHAPRDQLLEGLLNFLDALQDAAEIDGYPVVFLTEEPVP